MNPSSALTAIGAGGWWGAGVAYSEQKIFYSPLERTDFVFAIIAEEIGFIGSVFIITAYLIFALYGMRIASRLTSRFTCYMTLGFVVVVTAQTVLNIAVVTGMIPLSGLSLPFVTSTHHSLLTVGCMVGLIANAVYDQRGGDSLRISHLY